MDVHPTKNGIFIGIDPYPCIKMSSSLAALRDPFHAPRRIRGTVESRSATSWASWRRFQGDGGNLQGKTVRNAWETLTMNVHRKLNPPFRNPKNV